MEVLIMTRRMKYSGLVSLLICLLMLSGCTERGFENYEKAVALTDAVNSGENKTEVYLHYTFETEGLSDSDLKQLESFEEMSLAFTHAFNKEQDQYAIDGYLNFGGLGFDGAVYKNQEGHFAYLPMVNRYVHFEELVASGIFDDYVKGGQMAPPITDDMLKKLDAIWKGLLNTENVFTGKPILLQTDEGELKATVYEIKLTPEQIRQGMTDVLGLFREDKAWVSYIDEQLLKADSGMTFEELLQDHMWQTIFDSSVDFKFTTYVDRDGYIIKEHMTYAVTIADLDSILKSVEFGMETEYGKRDQVDVIAMPEFNLENTLRPEALQEFINSSKK
jgi:hypothetical protein